MVKIIGSKQTGKTERLISLSARTRGYIVCRNKICSEKIVILAKKMGLCIPYPMTYYDFIEGNYKDINVEKLYIDDVDELLQVMSCGKVEGITMSYGTEEFTP